MTGTVPAASPRSRAGACSDCGSGSRCTAGRSTRDRGRAAGGGCVPRSRCRSSPVPSAVRVVIADDQALVRSGFRLILESAGIDVAGEAADGKEAVAAVLEHRPDVVLMDIRMPVMDGLEATRQVIGAGSGTRVVMLTTFDLDRYVYEALAAGASGFLLKDVSPEHLVA